MLEHIAKILRNECNLDQKRPVIIGVSGGPDSLCLLSLLHKLEYDVIVAHLDHGLRPDSAEDASYVESICSHMGLCFRHRKLELLEISEITLHSIEETARSYRYKFLFQQALEVSAQAVATGHTADDQVETILMHILRGTGLNGMRGMRYFSLPNQWSSQIPLVRPLLGVWRDEILSYLKTEQFAARIDSSNQDPAYYRNRIRHQLIPDLESYNPGFRKRIWRTAKIINDDIATIDQVVMSTWDTCLRWEGANAIAFDYSRLQSLEEAILRHLFRRAIYMLIPEIRDVDYEALQRASKFIGSPPKSNCIDWIAGVTILLEDDLVWLNTKNTILPSFGIEHWPRMNPDESLFLPIPGSITLSSGWRLAAWQLDIQSFTTQKTAYKNTPYQAWLDAELLTTPLKVRPRRSGDRIQPLGLQGKSQKLSDLMINRKIPKRLREILPLIISGEEVAWVPGLQSSHTFRVTEGSQSIIHLAFEFKSK